MVFDFITSIKEIILPTFYILKSIIFAPIHVRKLIKHVIEKKN